MQQIEIRDATGNGKPVIEYAIGSPKWLEAFHFVRQNCFGSDSHKDMEEAYNQFIGGKIIGS